MRIGSKQQLVHILRFLGQSLRKILKLMPHFKPLGAPQPPRDTDGTAPKASQCYLQVHKLARSQECHNPQQLRTPTQPACSTSLSLPPPRAISLLRRIDARQLPRQRPLASTNPARLGRLCRALTSEPASRRLPHRFSEATLSKETHRIVPMVCWPLHGRPIAEKLDINVHGQPATFLQHNKRQTVH